MFLINFYTIGKEGEKKAFKIVSDLCPYSIKKNYKNQEEREKAVKTINRLCAKYKTKYKTECKTEYEVEWIFFENNPEKCLKNGRRAGRSIRVDRPRIC